MLAEKISENQLATFIACSISTSGIVIYREMFRNGQQDAWLGFFFPMLYAILIGLAIIYLTQGEQEKNLLKLNKKFFGLFTGSLINLLLFVYILLLIGMEINKLATTTKFFILPKTPLAILVVTLVVTITYLANTGIEVIMRFGNLVFIPYVIAIIILPVLLFQELDISNLLPIAANGLGQIVRGSYCQFALFGEVFLFSLILGNVASQNQLVGKHPLIRGAVLGAFLLTYVLLMIIFSIGVPLAKIGYLSPIQLTQQVHIAEFLDRIDLFLFTTWYPCILIKLVFLYYLLCVCISSIGEKNHPSKSYTIILIPLVFIVSQLFYHSMIQTFYFENNTWQLFTLGFQIALLFILCIKKWIKRLSLQ